MTKPLRTLLILLAMIVLLCVGAWLLLRTPTQPQTTEGGTVVSQLMADVATVTVQNEYGTYTVTQTAEGTTVEDLPADLVQLEYLAMLLDECSNVQYTQLVTEKADDLSLYGLSQPQTTVDITYADSTTLQINLGSHETVSDAYYFQTSQSDAVYLMKRSRTIRFMWPVTKFIDYIIIPPNESTSILSAVQDITFSGSMVGQTIELKAVLEDRPELLQMAISYGAVSHIMVQPSLHETNQTELLKIAESLCGLISEGVVDYNCTEKELASYGFDNPALQVQFDYKNGKEAEVETYNLRIVQQDGQYLATLNDWGVVYKIAAVDFLNVTYDNLILRWFLSPFITDVQQLEVTFGNDTYVFALSGETAQELKALCNGASIDSEQMRKYYNLVTSAAAEERLADTAPATQLVATVRFVYKNTEKADDVMCLYQGDARRVLVEINGEMQATMKNTYVTCLQQATDNLANGQSFSTEW